MYWCVLRASNCLVYMTGGHDCRLPLGVRRYCLSYIGLDGDSIPSKAVCTPRWRWPRLWAVYLTRHPDSGHAGGIVAGAGI